VLYVPPPLLVIGFVFVGAVVLAVLLAVFLAVSLIAIVV
jgi:hypothetical protein